MLFFGYIVTDIRYKDISEDIVKVVEDADECINPLPRLIIGLDNAKKYAEKNGFEFDILDHSYPNGDMWTFKKTEKREFYEEDLEAFKKNIIEAQCENVKYYYTNIYNLKYSKIKKLYNIIFDSSVNYIIVDGEMFYIALNDTDVIGISFSHLSYIGIDREKIIRKLKSSYNNKLYYTTSKNMWQLKNWFDGREFVIASIFKKNAKKDK